MAIITVVTDFSKYGTMDNQTAGVVCEIHNNRLIRRSGAATYVVDATDAASDNILCGDCMALCNQLHSTLGIHLDADALVYTHDNAVSKLSEFMTDLLQTYASMSDYHERRNAINQLIGLFFSLEADLEDIGIDCMPVDRRRNLAESIIDTLTRHMKLNMRYAMTTSNSINDLSYCLDDFISKVTRGVSISADDDDANNEDDDNGENTGDTDVT